MTARITVHAGHGWPVDVTSIPLNGEKSGEHKTRVAANATQDFCVHSAHDLLIHEVQPAEVAAEADAQQPETAEDAPAA